MERSSGGKTVQRTLGSDEKISRKKAARALGGEAPRPSKFTCREMTTDTIDQTAKAEFVPGRAGAQNCEVPHIRAAEPGAKVRVRCIRRAPRLAHARARSMSPRRAGFHWQPSDRALVERDRWAEILDFRGLVGVSRMIF
jgi:hypothetical protein